RRDRSFRQQRFGIGGHFVDLDAHVIDHADDVFDLLRIDDVVGQVVVDLGVGQITLFFALDNQGLNFGLLLLGGGFGCHGYAASMQRPLSIGRVSRVKRERGKGRWERKIESWNRPSSYPLPSPLSLLPYLASSQNVTGP